MGKKVLAKDILPHIKGTGGILTTIAKRVGCSRQTMIKCKQRYKTVRKAIEQEKQRVGDRAEQNIIKAIFDGDMKLSKWYCKVKLTERGYGELQKHKGKLEIDLTEQVKELDKDIREEIRQERKEEVEDASSDD